MTDYFSGQAAAYAGFRPDYPAELFHWLASQSPGRERAWDCATGSGQAASGLADHFHLVLASDLSLNQLQHAVSHHSIHYFSATAEQVPLPDHCLQLITVAQALHWFDRDRFYREVDRLLVRGGLLAAWSYGPFYSKYPELNASIDWFRYELVGPFWPPERALVENGYRDITLPWRELQTPQFRLQRDLRLDELLGYVGSWSATAEYRRHTDRDPLLQWRTVLERLWPADNVTFHWPLTLKSARKPS